MQKLATAVAVGLALASSGAMALGLGDIEMRSALNQPLDAEIVLNSVQADELDGLIVQLASREAFERAGIEKSPVLSALKFSVNQKADGTHYIKVGSRGPVVEPFLNFLLEVDWPRGRMVREYTILLDPPVFMSQDAVSSTSTPSVPETVSQQIVEQDLAVPVPIQRSTDDEEEAIEVIVANDAGSDVDDSTRFPAEEVIIDSIVISSDTTNLEQVDNSTLSSTDGNEDGVAYLLDGVRTTSTSIPIATTYPLEVFAETSTDSNENTLTAVSDDVPEVVVVGGSEEVSSGQTGGGSNSGGADAYTVVKNDTLWQIAASNKPADFTVQQMMLALLSANRNAFVDGNVNRLREGAILRMPSGNEISSLSRQQAIAQMTQQNRLWQEYRDSIGRIAAPSGIGKTPEIQAETSNAITASESDSTSSDSEPNVGDSTEVVTQAPAAELSIVADPSTSDNSATANANESEQPDTKILGQINTDLTLAQEELEAEQLKKEDLQAQASELESNTEKMDRLIELRENEMAQLQEKLSTAEAQAAAEAEAKVAAEVQAAAEAEAKVAAEAQAAAEAEAKVAAEAAAEAQAAAEAEAQAVTPSVVESESESASVEEGISTDDIEIAGVEPSAEALENEQSPVQEGTFFQKLMDNPAQAAGIGLGVLGLLGALAWLLGRGGRKEEELDDDVVLADEEIFEDEQSTVTQQVATLDQSVEGSPDVNEAELSEIQNFDNTDDESVYEEFDHTDLLASSVDDESAKDDTISEAEVYLAYGLHGQAEDLLTKAVDREPENQDYHLKLLETHHGQKDSDRFNKSAQQFHSRFGGDSNPAWQQIATMGRELDTDNTLYVVDSGGNQSGMGAITAGVAGVAGVGAAVSGIFDSSTDDKEPDGTLSLSEFDSTGDVTEIIAPPNEDVSLQSLSEEQSLLDQSIDPGLAFDEAELEATGDFSKLSAEVNEELDQPLPDLSDLHAKDVLTEVSADLESSMDDSVLEFDSGLSLESSTEQLISSAVEEKTDDTSDLGSMLEEIELEDGDSGSARVLTAVSSEIDLDSLNETNMSEFEQTGLDIDESVLDLSSLKDNDISEVQIDDLDITGSPDELTLDIDQLVEVKDSNVGTNVESMFDHTETLDTAFDQTQELEIPDLTSSTDLTVGDGSAAFGSTNEMETMLDLAKAYIDMGDNDSASSALDEIIKEGSNEQKETAEQLLRKIG